MTGTINQLWTIANMLTLFKGPLVKEWSKWENNGNLSYQYKIWCTCTTCNLSD